MTEVTNDHDSIPERARKRYFSATEDPSERLNREQAKTDLLWLVDDGSQGADGSVYEGQWSAAERRDRETDGRPCLVFNELHAPVDKVVNQITENRPGPNISPVGGGADSDMADLIASMIRSIERNSNAGSQVYPQVAKYEVGSSRGVMRISIVYPHERSMQRELRYELEPDPAVVWFDPTSVLPYRRDAKWACKIRTYQMEEYKLRWPDSKVANFSGGRISLNTISSAFGAGNGLVNSREVGVLEYWEKKTEIKRLYDCADGIARFKEDPGFSKADFDAYRDVDCDTVTQYLTNGYELLEEPYEWPAPFIPLIEFCGRELYVDGKRVTSSIIRYARHAQKLLNYALTCATEAISLVPRAPFVGFIGQFKTKMADWQSSNRKLHAYLEADPILLPGSQGVAPLPQRNNVEPPVQAALTVAAFARETIHSTSQTFDASQGRGEATQSGSAIKALQLGNDISNAHYANAFYGGVEFAYLQTLYLIPKVYDRTQVMQIVRPGDKVEAQLINQEFQAEIHGSDIPKMQRKHPYLVKDVRIGEYAVAVSVGKSYDTQRQQTAAALEQMAKAMPPEMFARIVDIWVKLQDLGPEGEELAKRLAPPGSSEDMDPAQAAQQLQQLGQQNQQLQTIVQHLQQVIETKQIEGQNKLDVVALQGKFGIIETQIRAGAQMDVAKVNNELEGIRTMIEMAHERRMAHDDRAHEVGMTAITKPKEEKAA